MMHVIKFLCAFLTWDMLSHAHALSARVVISNQYLGTHHCDKILGERDEIFQ